MGYPTARPCALPVSGSLGWTGGIAPKAKLILGSWRCHDHLLHLQARIAFIIQHAGSDPKQPYIDGY